MNYEKQGYKSDEQRHKINQKHTQHNPESGDRKQQDTQNLRPSIQRSNRQIADCGPTNGYYHKNRQLSHHSAMFSPQQSDDKSFTNLEAQQPAGNQPLNPDKPDREISQIRFPISERLRCWVQYYRWHDTGHKKHPLIFQQKFGEEINAIVLEMEMNGQKIRGQQILDHYNKVVFLCDEIDTLCRLGCSNAVEENRLDHLCGTIKTTVFRLADLIDGYCSLPQSPEPSKLQQGRIVSESQRTPPIKIVEIPAEKPTVPLKRPVEVLTKADSDILKAMSTRPKANMFRVDIEAVSKYGRHAVTQSIKRLESMQLVCKTDGVGRKGWMITEKGISLSAKLP